MRYAIQPSRAREIARLPEAARKVARLCDGRRTLTELTSDLRLPEPWVAKVVAKLGELGVVQLLSEPMPGQSATPAVPPAVMVERFSDDEEAFFASSVDHLAEF